MKMYFAIFGIVFLIIIGVTAFSNYVDNLSQKETTAFQAGVKKGFRDGYYRGRIDSYDRIIYLLDSIKKERKFTINNK